MRWLVGRLDLKTRAEYRYEYRSTRSYIYTGFHLIGCKWMETKPIPLQPCSAVLAVVLACPGLFGPAPGYVDPVND